MMVRGIIIACCCQRICVAMTVPEASSDEAIQELRKARLNKIMERAELMINLDDQRGRLWSKCFEKGG